MLDCSNKQAIFENALKDYTSDVQTKVDEESKKFEAETKQKEEESKKDFVEFKFKVDWKITSILIPEIKVEMKERKFAYHVPQVTFNDKKIVLKSPSIRMVRKKIGQKPEVVCEPTWIKVGGFRTKGVPKCTVKWTDIFADVPEPFEETHEIIIKIPEFKFARTETKLHLPEVFTSQKEIKLHLPHFTLIEAYINREDDKKRAKEYESEIQGLSDAMTARIQTIREEEKAEIIFPLNDYFDCIVSSLKTSKIDVLTGIELAITNADSTLKVLESKGAGNSEDAVALRTELEKLRKQRSEQSSYFDTQIETLLNQEREIVDSLAASSD